MERTFATDYTSILEKLDQVRKGAMLAGLFSTRGAGKRFEYRNKTTSNIRNKS